MRTLLSKALMAGLPALALLVAPAQAQDPQGGAEPPNKTIDGNVQARPPAAPQQGEVRRTADSLIGREVRTDQEGGRVIGEIRDVIPGTGGAGPRVVIALEAHDQKPVAVDLSQLRQEGNRWFITVPEEQLAALPAHAGGEGTAGGTSMPLPMGGLAPGWGIQQGGQGTGR